MRRVFISLACALAAGSAIVTTIEPVHAQTPSFDYQTTETQRAGTTRYIVRPGDTLYSIARMVGVPLSVILSLNPDLDSRAFSCPAISYPCRENASSSARRQGVQERRWNCVARDSGPTPG